MSDNGAVDELAAALDKLSQPVSHYYLALLRCGIGADHALELTKALQTELFQIATLQAKQ